VDVSVRQAEGGDAKRERWRLEEHLAALTLQVSNAEQGVEDVRLGVLHEEARTSALENQVGHLLSRVESLVNAKMGQDTSAPGSLQQTDEGLM